MYKQILSCDWGTSSFRLRLLDVESGAVLAEIKDAKGVASAYENWLQNGLPEEERVLFYVDTILEKIESLTSESLEGMPVFISGMASSSIGMSELSYAEVPFSINGNSLEYKRFDVKNHSLFLFSGVRTANDVMRGEETILCGCNLSKDEAHIVILPGTHSKHAFIKNGVMHDFKTYMTGEFFDLLSVKSLLAKAVSKTVNGIFYKEDFERGVKHGAEGNILNTAFHVRTETLLNKAFPEKNFYFLSGLLISAELKDLKDKQEQIHLVCSDAFMRLYQIALALLYPDKLVTYTNADEAFSKGHCKLAKELINHVI